jgi:hypothetical protein
MVEKWWKKASAQLLAIFTAGLAVADLAFSELPGLREYLNPELYKWIFLALFVIRILQRVESDPDK